MFSHGKNDAKHNGCGYCERSPTDGRRSKRNGQLWSCRASIPVPQAGFTASRCVKHRRAACNFPEMQS